MTTHMMNHVLVQLMSHHVIWADAASYLRPCGIVAAWGDLTPAVRLHTTNLFVR